MKFNHHCRLTPHGYYVPLEDSLPSKQTNTPMISSHVDIPSDFWIPQPVQVISRRKVKFSALSASVRGKRSGRT